MVREIARWVGASIWCAVFGHNYKVHPVVLYQVGTVKMCQRCKVFNAMDEWVAR